MAIQAFLKKNLTILYLKVQKVSRVNRRKEIIKIKKEIKYRPEINSYRKDL